MKPDSFEEGAKLFQRDVYERNIFTIKDSRFKSDSFLDEVKRSYTDLINIYVRDDKVLFCTLNDASFFTLKSAVSA